MTWQLWLAVLVFWIVGFATGWNAQRNYGSTATHGAPNSADL